MSDQHGTFIWYELLTSDNDAALAFYSEILGWQAIDSGQPDMDYRILQARDEETGKLIEVSGLMQLTAEMRQGGSMPIWLGYIGVDDVDQSISHIVAAGGQVLMPASDIPDVGRIAMVTDPQGTPFYVMHAIGDEASQAFAADKPRVGHCAWNELATPDPEAAKAFYFKEFGWSKDGDMDMGPMGSYEFIRHNGIIGAFMPGSEDGPMWQYYFRCANIDDACKAIIENGGQILHGPDEIPGGDFIIKGVDPQGALFALVGAKSNHSK
ncbi:VOC family protein [Gynuella sunshinyii]|uniref:Putative enzyme-like lactoylglutathione lyase n=1 Tax=Gynuella sunshinyii YC6258 TaxID=1445510 RepID=A0A0C5VMW4_9GAMM|nr:VOC family protein [Gynuella sunshinyii]AJQ95646.1 putative enzyme-like lactoylglutathione lyase [Gynuella sunshinyii YC6258]